MGKEISPKKWDTSKSLEHRVITREIDQTNRYNDWKEINIACLQHSKHIGEKATKVGKTDYKLWYTKKVRNKNRVRIVTDKS